ncbi:MAG: hypothetical protein JNK48_05190 [Bryobacterales bacterium]|nr:hypothetical protein [Bryobacterales bacterium]
MEGPLVLSLEDLHWADLSTLDLLSALARRHGAVPLMVIGTFRSVEVALSQSPLKGLKQDLLLGGLCNELKLQRLDEAQVGEYLSSRTGADTRDALPQLIHLHSDGNPLFMVLTVDHLAAMNRLSPEGMRSAGIPESLKQLVESQYEKLSAGDQAIVSAACVAGYEFSADSIAAMLDLGIEASEAACEALASTGRLVMPGNGGHYQFRHAIHRESLYQRLRPTQRKRFHRKLAEALAQTSAVQERASEIAVHFERAECYAGAVRYLLQSAENARGRFAVSEAIQQQKHALELAAKIHGAEQGELEVACLLRIGMTQNDATEIGLAIENLERSARRARELRLPVAEVEALENLVVSVSLGNQHNPAEILDRAMEAGRRAGPPHLSRISHFASAMRIVCGGWSHQDSDSCHRTWAEMTVQHPATIRPIDSILRGNTLLLEGRFREAAGLVSFSDRDATVSTVAMKVFAHIQALFHLGKQREALQAGESILALAVRNAHPHWAAMMRAWIAGIRVRLGDYACARGACAQLTGPEVLPVIRSTALLTLGMAELGMGNPTEANRYFQGQLALSAANPSYPHVSFSALLGVAQAEAAQGRWSDARASVNRLLAEIHGTKLLPLRTEASAHAAEFAMQAGDMDGARQHLEDAFSADGQCDPPRYGWRLYAISASLAGQLGDEATARDHRQLADRLSFAIADSFPEDDPLRGFFLSTLRR